MATHSAEYVVITRSRPVPVAILGLALQAELPGKNGSRQGRDDQDSKPNQPYRFMFHFLLVIAPKKRMLPPLGRFPRPVGLQASKPERPGKTRS